MPRDRARFVSSLACLAASLALARASYAALAPSPAPDPRLFPEPGRAIVLVAAAEPRGKGLVGRELPADDELGRAIALQLDDPFYRSLVRIHQAARNLAGDRDGPNVLYLSGDEGGFARQGLTLLTPEGERRYPRLNYVDLVVDRTGLEAGALDIFAHELGHAMMGVLWPRMGEGAEQRLTPKMHLSMGATDDYTALHEGFGIHFERLTQERIPVYRELFEARLRRADSTATWWHSTIDSELRQNAVLQNRYVFQRLLPGGIPITPLSAEQRILLAHASPIFDPSRLRNARQMLASEGVVATFFYRAASSEKLASSWREAEFYRPFLARTGGEPLRPEELFTPFENLYLKQLWIWHRLNDAGDDGGAHPLLVRYIGEWLRAFPADREALLEIFLGTTVGRTADRQLGEMFLAVSRAGLAGDYQAYGKARAAYQERFAETLKKLVASTLALDAEVGPELWIEVPGVTVRHALWAPEPRAPLRMDLNVADEIELSVLPGMDAALAERIVRRRDELGAFRSLAELEELGVRLGAERE